MRVNREIREKLKKLKINKNKQVVKKKRKMKKCLNAPQEIEHKRRTRTKTR